MLTEAEVACIKQELGEAAFELLLDQPVMDEGPLNVALPIGCLAQETVAAVVVAGLDGAAGGLSDESAACIRGTFSGIDIDSLGTLAPSTLDVSDPSQGLGTQSLRWASNGGREAA